MSDAVINRNKDLLELQNQGYELDIKEGCAIVRNIPYLNHNLDIRYGILVSPINMINDIVKYDGQHVIYFSGEEPYRKNGERLDAIILGSVNQTLAGIHVNFQFSNKPSNGYKDYFGKFTRYIDILTSEARAVDSSVTAKTFKKVISYEDSIHWYTDTNSSRAAITDINDKLKGHNIAIIGLGGTGSYILDQIAKTPVSSIHLFDGDLFCQHNAFRAPGAPPKEIFPKQFNKADYYKFEYGNMHKGIISHPYFVDENNVDELSGCDFVFLALDSGSSKRIIINYAVVNGMEFIDCGIDVIRQNDYLIGLLRNTFYRGNNIETIKTHISFDSDDNDLYRSNIQTSELNTLSAIMAVIEWKKRCGFYLSICEKDNYVFSTDTGENVWS
ncbi:MAG: ThiF family adenylyltransferase [Erysipelotrichaceae bacterium]|nr:ThiF family adenylyltransferase [Erysipelotrichaceae bacterium]